VLIRSKRSLQSRQWYTNYIPSFALYVYIYIYIYIYDIPTEVVCTMRLNTSAIANIPAMISLVTYTASRQRPPIIKWLMARSADPLEMCPKLQLAFTTQIFLYIRRNRFGPPYAVLHTCYRMDADIHCSDQPGVSVSYHSCNHHGTSVGHTSCRHSRSTVMIARVWSGCVSGYGSVSGSWFGSGFFVVSKFVSF
jgi:hypothetical protein